ncbi:MAG: hypothetical protein HRT36_03160 [Alphaproteobacteria bacterium]|nr:hypothetical protein [Alphaproteobacteria bacterium]
MGAHPDGVTADLIRNTNFTIQICLEKFSAEASLKAFCELKFLRRKAN